MANNNTINTTSERLLNKIRTYICANCQTMRRTTFRTERCSYCNYINPISPGLIMRRTFGDGTETHQMSHEDIRDLARLGINKVEQSDPCISCGCTSYSVAQRSPKIYCCINEKCMQLYQLQVEVQ